MRSPRSFVLVGLLFVGFSPLVLPIRGQDGTYDRRTVRSVGSGTQRSYYIQGRVLNANDNGPVYAAQVVLTSLGGIPVARTATDSEGGFYFRQLAAGTYELWVTSQGYREARETVRLLIGPEPGVFVFLHPKSAASAPLLIEPLSVEEQQVPKQARREYEEGVKKLRARLWQESRAYFEAALESYPRYASARAGLGIALLQQMDMAGAQQAFQSAVEINANYALPRIYLGALYNAQRRYLDALEQLRVALRLQPNSWLAHFESSRAYWGLRDLARAEEHIIRAHGPDSPVPQVHLMRANVYAARQDYAGAVGEMDEFLELASEGPLAQLVRQRRGQLQEKLAQVEDPQDE